MALVVAAIVFAGLAKREIQNSAVTETERQCLILATCAFTVAGIYAAAKALKIISLSKQLGNVVAVAGRNLVIDGATFNLADAEIKPLPDPYLNQHWPLSEYFVVTEKGRTAVFAPSLLLVEFREALADALRANGRAVPEFFSPNMRRRRFES